jgi:choline dehydrogenase
LRQRLGIVATFVTSREGPISNLFESVAFLKSSPAEPRPDIQLHFLPIGYVMKRGGAFELTPYPAATVLLNKSYPVSRGRITLASSRPEDSPRIECRLLEDVDVETLIRGVNVVRTIARTEPLASLLEGEVVPGPEVEGPQALRDYIRNHTGIAYHPIGTCRLGTDADAVVGPDLRVHGTENVWVADASVMPNLISGNTNAACMMIGAKLGRELQVRRQA